MHRWTAAVVKVQGQDVGAGIMHGVGQGLSKVARVLRLMPRAMPWLPGAHDVDGAGGALGQVAAAHHGEAMKWVEGVGEAVLADVLLLVAKYLPYRFMSGRMFM